MVIKRSNYIIFYNIKTLKFKKHTYIHTNNYFCKCCSKTQKIINQKKHTVKKKITFGKQGTGKSWARQKTSKVLSK